jgi:hypothetical protein
MTITAKIIADSINPWGKRITTFELEYPRLIHSELMTHRQFSRNAASSRAIPVSSVIQQVVDNPAMPFKWGKNQAGMQAKENVDELTSKAAEATWLSARDSAVSYAKVLSSMGLHKQVVNRLLEPFQYIKVVMTTTEYENWKWLRLHPDADPTIHELANVMEIARNESKPVELDEGQWHIPYVAQLYKKQRNNLNIQEFFDEAGDPVTIEQALKISASCCAQVSYRKNDGSLEKAETIYSKLIESEPAHSSPTEHQARVLKLGDTEGITSVNYALEDYYDELESILAVNSGNFSGGWIQYRQLIPNNVKL